MSTVFDHVASRYPRLARGFDDPGGWLPHFAIPELSEDGEGVRFSREPLEEDVRGSFAAISALSGFIAGCLPCEPSQDLTPALRCFAQALENQARALRVALEGR